MRFTPIESFYSNEMQCHYLKGFRYEIFCDTPEADKKFSEMISVWLSEKKVKLVDVNGTGGHFSMSGQGSVQ